MVGQEGLHLLLDQKWWRCGGGGGEACILWLWKGREMSNPAASLRGIFKKDSKVSWREKVSAFS